MGRKSQVIDHALHLFTDKGISHTSIQDILDRAEISKGTFYNYFSSKNECVGAVLQKIHQDLWMTRSELQTGKDADDIEVLIQQIASITMINQKYSLHILFEELLYSTDKELKQHVIGYSLRETDWLCGRLIDVYGERIRGVAFEAAILYFGMRQHIMFASKIIHQFDMAPQEVAQTILRYVEMILDDLTQRGHGLLDAQKLQQFTSRPANEKVSCHDILQTMDELSHLHAFTKPQEELHAALRGELQMQPRRDTVIHALLNPFQEAFKGSALQMQAKQLINMIWRYLQQ